MNEECCVHGYLKLPLTLNSCHVKFLYWTMMHDDCALCNGLHGHGVYGLMYVLSLSQHWPPQCESMDISDSNIL